MVSKQIIVKRNKRTTSFAHHPAIDKPHCFFPVMAAPKQAVYDSMRLSRIYDRSGINA
jgi:hypothetical protein